MTKIIFLDVDGPLIPLRMYFRGGRIYNVELNAFVYDPVAIGMINHLCETYDCQVVFNTMHNENPPEVMLHQATVNGIKKLHSSIKTNFPTINDNRLFGIYDWMKEHPEIEDYIIIDDMNVLKSKQVLVDFRMGLTIDDFYKAVELLSGQKLPLVVGVNGIV